MQRSLEQMRAQPEKVRAYTDGYTGFFNWDASQPVRHNSLSAYIDAAEQRKELFGRMITDFTNSLPFAVEIIPPCVKKIDSCERKLYDRNNNHFGQMEHIKDFLRATIIIPEGKGSILALKRTIDRSTTDPNTIAYKDQFWKPEKETGFRSFKASWDVDGHRAELKIEHGGMNEANKYTEMLRHYERAIKEAEPKFSSRCISPTDSSYRSVTRMMVNAETKIGEIRNLRQQFHDTFAHDAGLDVLLDPSLHVQSFSFFDLGNAFNKAAQGMFGKPLKRIAQQWGTSATDLGMSLNMR